MKKIRSKALWQYLMEQGVLESSQEAIKQAKVEYRRKYKHEWRKKTRKPRELRPTFTNQEFEGLMSRAKLYGFNNPTSYARQIILNAQQDIPLIPNFDKLLHILATISMAEICLGKSQDVAEATTLLLEAEDQLLNYLNIKKRDR